MKEINVIKSFLPPFEEYTEKIKTIWEKNWLTNCGVLHNELEVKLSKYLKTENGILFTNGHLALESALELLDLKGEVITTPFTFASTTHAIVRKGLKPIFCDINLEDYTIDVEKIEKLITKETCAIVPVHVFGYPCKCEKIEHIAKKYNLKVIYDSAHAFGVEVQGRGIGSFGDMSMFSLHATKVYGSIEGGFLTYGNRSYSKSLKELKNFGITGPESVESVGFNAKMNEFQAAMGLVNLNYIDKEIESRKRVVEIYRSEFKKIEGIKVLEDIENIKHNYAYFPIVINEKITRVDRNKLYEELKNYKIFTRKYFYPLITEFECYKGKFSDENLENAKYISERVLTLPMYGELTDEEVIYICNSIKNIIKK